MFGPSSCVKTAGATSRPATDLGMVSGIVSSLNRPSRSARNARRWLSTAKRSCSSRPIPNSSARFSAVLPMSWPQNGSVNPSQMLSKNSAWRSQFPQLLGRDVLEGPPEVSDRRPHSRDDDDLFHVCPPLLRGLPNLARQAIGDGEAYLFIPQRPSQDLADHRSRQLLAERDGRGNL